MIDGALFDARGRQAWAAVLREAAGRDARRLCVTGRGGAELAVLLAELGYEVALLQGEVSGGYDAVLVCDGVAAEAEPVAAIARWSRLVRPGGRLAFIEAQQPGGGVHNCRLAGILQHQGMRDLTSMPLMDPRLWKQKPNGLRYLMTASSRCRE